MNTASGLRVRCSQEVFISSGGLLSHCCLCLPDRKCALSLRSPSLLDQAGSFLSSTSFRLLTSTTLLFIQESLLSTYFDNNSKNRAYFTLSCYFRLTISIKRPIPWTTGKVKGICNLKFIKGYPLFFFPLNLCPKSPLTYPRSWGLFCFGVWFCLPITKKTHAWLYDSVHERVVFPVCMARGKEDALSWLGDIFESSFPFA